jgi:hypothetical protein
MLVLDVKQTGGLSLSHRGGMEKALGISLIVGEPEHSVMKDSVRLQG